MIKYENVFLTKQRILGAYLKQNEKMRNVLKNINGARGRTRTDTRLPLPDFESGASTSFTTRAKNRNFIKNI